MISETRKLELMRETVQEALRSVPEDDRPHPKVGALLTDADGKIKYRAHRGEEELGGHAEFHLFRKAERDGFNTKDCVLFVSLEPCTRRGKDKTPCAVRVAESGVKQIYIGTLDPNTHITGRGDMFLSFHMAVDHFPSEIKSELFAINQEFFDRYRYTHIPVVSSYAGYASDQPQVSFRPVLAGQREGILLQSLDLISGTDDDVSIFAGDLSWVYDLQLSLVLAKLDKRRVRILCDDAKRRTGDFNARKEMAKALGADVAMVTDSLRLRGTLVSPYTSNAAVMCVEKRPALHAQLFQAPHESGLIRAVSYLFESCWAQATVEPGTQPRFTQIPTDKIIAALKANVPAYGGATIELAAAPISKLKPLAKCLERFKLLRLSQLAVLTERHAVRLPTTIQGSPRAIIHPVVELTPQGDLVIIDGTHRVYSALSRNLETIEVFLVKNAGTPPPATPLSNWDAVKVTTEKHPRDLRYTDYRQERFRPIRTAVSALAGFTPAAPQQPGHGHM
jgi:pyrimidine deaminase RibD-like protein